MSACLPCSYDEVNFACWEDDPTVQAYMKRHGLDTHGLLLEYFLEQRHRLQLVAPNRKAIYWEEVALQGLPLSSNDIVQVWSDKSALQSVLDHSPASVLISWAEHYYLDCGRGNMFGDQSWCDPYKTALDT
jgi:hexosaminidase